MASRWNPQVWHAHVNRLPVRQIDSRQAASGHAQRSNGVKQNSAMFNIAIAPKPAAQALLQDGLSLMQPDELTTTLSLDHGGWRGHWDSLASSWDRLAP